MAASDDSKIDIFIDNICLEPGCRTSEMEVLCSDKRIAEAVAIFKKKTILLYFGLNYMNCEALSRHFSAVIPVRRNVFALITSHCYSFYQLCPDPFLAFLYFSYFVFSTLCFFCFKNLPEYQAFRPICLKSLFHQKIKGDFYAKGGWEKLLNFSVSDNIPKLIDLISDLYAARYNLYRIGVDNNITGSFGICSGKVVKICLEKMKEFRTYVDIGFYFLPENKKIEESFKRLEFVLKTKLGISGA